jgi:hypothetical protein
MYTPRVGHSVQKNEVVSVGQQRTHATRRIRTRDPKEPVLTHGPLDFQGNYLGQNMHHTPNYVFPPYVTEDPLLLKIL